METERIYILKACVSFAIWKNLEKRNEVEFLKGAPITGQSRENVTPFFDEDWKLIKTFTIQQVWFGNIDSLFSIKGGYLQKFNKLEFNTIALV
jgi:hypothetical protein